MRERDVLGEAEVSDHDQRPTRAIRPTGTGVPRLRGVARASLRLSVGRGRWVPGTLPMHRLADRVGLVAGLALLRLARAPRCSGTGSCAGGCRPSGRWPAPRTPRALVVRALRRRDDDEALPGAVAVALARAARRCCGTTASRSCRSSAPARGSRASGSASSRCVGQPLDAARDERVRRRSPAASRSSGEPAVERRRLGQRRACRPRARRRGPAPRRAAPATPGAQLAEEACGVARGTAAAAGSSRIAASSAARALGDRLLDVGACDRARAP